MYYIDTHTHTNFSFDGHNTPDEMCAAAVAAGLAVIAITDHYDADGVIEGLYPPYFAEEAKNAILAARTKYAPELRVVYGIEIGQPYAYPAECEAFTRECGFDFIICSLHNLIGVPDFSFLKYDNMPQELIERLWERALEEIYTLLLGYKGFTINTLGHLTYPVRYIKRAGRELDMTRFYDSTAQIYRRMKERGIALEVNTSGIRGGAGMTFPDTGLLRLYRECGGEMLTVGSDAHYAADIGADIADTYDMLAGLGFRYVTYFIEGKPEFIKITD
jgi:histidinol-phosphatase (PHP family)